MPATGIGDEWGLKENRRSLRVPPIRNHDQGHTEYSVDR